ncbi:unnamed protein product [Enterobius vermicularis]|uniref:Uncharacterized protein n=1 Tax=Enterobius vermicularis TaxID=51028 RepID=A0A0N4VG60_ENTVE|nr:unnamed protein product [Enterobius vermicularis]
MVKQHTRKRFSYDFEGGFQERELELIEIENSVQTKPAGNIADSLSQIFVLCPRPEVRQQAYNILGVKSNHDFAVNLQSRINAFLKHDSKKKEKRSCLEIRKEKELVSKYIRLHFGDSSFCDRIKGCLEGTSDLVSSQSFNAQSESSSSSLSTSDFSDSDTEESGKLRESNNDGYYSNEEISGRTFRTEPSRCKFYNRMSTDDTEFFHENMVSDGEFSDGNSSSSSWSEEGSDFSSDLISDPESLKSGDVLKGQGRKEMLPQKMHGNS